jgi:hypothetical protein
MLRPSKTASSILWPIWCVRPDPEAGFTVLAELERQGRFALLPPLTPGASITENEAITVLAVAPAGLRALRPWTFRRATSAIPRVSRQAGHATS